MASRRLSSLLALEVESADRPSDERPGDSGVDPPHLSRESAVGRGSNSIGNAPTRVKCDGKDGGEISGETRQASLADLENISCQSCESDCGRRFFHNPDDQFPRFVLLHCPPSRSQEDRSFQCDHESDSPLGRTANHRSISRCYRSLENVEIWTLAGF